MPNEITQSAAGIANATSLAQTHRASDISMDDFLKILAATMSNPSLAVTLQAAERITFLNWSSLLHWNN